MPLPLSAGVTSKCRAERSNDAALWQNLVTASNPEPASSRSSVWRAAGRWAGGVSLAGVGVGGVWAYPALGYVLAGGAAPAMLALVIVTAVTILSSKEEDPRFERLMRLSCL